MPTKIPVTNDGNRTIQVNPGNGISYIFRTYYSTGMENAWFLDISDTNGVPLLAGIPIVPGSRNILKGHGDTLRDVELAAVSTSGNPQDPEALGRTLFLLWFNEGEINPFADRDPLVDINAADWGWNDSSAPQNDHNKLENRFIPEQHDIPSIVGLQTALDSKAGAQELAEAVGSEAQARSEADAGIQAGLDRHAADKGNPHGVTAEQIGAMPIAPTGPHYADGSGWVGFNPDADRLPAGRRPGDMLVVDRNNAPVWRQPADVVAGLGQRQFLTENVSFYIRKDGSDANDGRSAATAFLTVGRFFDELKKYNGNGFSCQVFPGPGVWEENNYAALFGFREDIVQGFNSISIQGAGKDNTVFRGVGDHATSGIRVHPHFSIPVYITAAGVENVWVGIMAEENGTIYFSDFNFGDASYRHIYAKGGIAGILGALGQYQVSGPAGMHIQAVGAGGQVLISGATIDFLADNLITHTFAWAESYGYISAYNNTFNGPAQPCARYSANFFGSIFTNGGGENYFPGARAGYTGPAYGVYA